MPFESLPETHAACEQITSPLQPAHVITTLLLLSLGFNCIRFLKEPPSYYPYISVFFKDIFMIGFGMLLDPWRCKQSQVNNQEASREDFASYLVLSSLFLVCYVT